jgi:hypothetical protein
MPVSSNKSVRIDFVEDSDEDINDGNKTVIINDVEYAQVKKKRGRKTNKQREAEQREREESADRQQQRGGTRAAPPKKTYAAAAAPAAKSSRSRKPLSDHDMLVEALKRIEELEKEVKLLRQQTKEKSPQAKDAQSQRFERINEVTREQQEIKKRAKKVVLHGLKPADTGDRENDAGLNVAAVEKFIQALEEDDHLKISVEVKQVNVIWPRKEKNEFVSKPTFLVVLGSEEQRGALLDGARHHSLEDFKGTWAHEDRTPAQQAEHRECRRLCMEKNEPLKALNMLDKPFRYVGRSGRPVCIDVAESKKGRTVYRSPTTQELLSAKLNGAIANGHIDDNRRSQMPKANALASTTLAATANATA